jgi:hypothetical protein
MRLSPRKIESLATAIHRALAANPQVQLQAPPDQVTRLIRQIIADDMKIEEEIEQEAKRLLEENLTEMQRATAPMDALLRKTKAKLARDRKFVL